MTASDTVIERYYHINHAVAKLKELATRRRWANIKVWTYENKFDTRGILMTSYPSAGTPGFRQIAFKNNIDRNNLQLVSIWIGTIWTKAISQSLSEDISETKEKVKQLNITLKNTEATAAGSRYYASGLPVEQTQVQPSISEAMARAVRIAQENQFMRDPPMKRELN